MCFKRMGAVSDHFVMDPCAYLLGQTSMLFMVVWVKYEAMKMPGSALLTPLEAKRGPD